MNKGFNCRECGIYFTTDVQESRTIFCNDKCARKHNRRKGKYKRRQLMKKQWVERVKLNVLVERDAYTCQLCGKFVDMKLEGTSEKNAPSIDHVVPLSKGGEHSYNNTQLAHHYCNTIKNDDLIEGEENG